METLTPNTQNNQEQLAAPERTWQDVEEDIAAGHDLQDDVTSKEEGNALLGELNGLYTESKEKFEEAQTSRMLESGNVTSEDIGTESLTDAIARKREQQRKAKEEYDVQNGNVGENSFNMHD